MAHPSPGERQSLAARGVAEIDILWITAGLGCDGDTIAMTAATQPSLEDVLLGALPWLPKVRLHNPFIAFENGDDFLEPFHRASAGGLALFILVVEGSIPNEQNKEEGYWASFGTDQKTGQPITTCEWIDRLAPKADHIPFACNRARRSAAAFRTDGVSSALLIHSIFRPLGKNWACSL